MSAVSQNGWPVSPNEADLDITPLVVGGVAFSPGVRGGKVHDLLSYVAHAVHTRVQKANSTYGCWGYSFRENVNSPGEWSNHASGTAIDFNATRHPNGQPTVLNWTADQIIEIYKILDEVDNVVRWGGDYEGTPDAMHFEINVPPDQLDVAIPEVPKAGSVWPIGVQFIDLNDLENMPELTEMSVSYPTHMAYSGGQAGWVFRPTQSGQISIDALLSHHTDPNYWSSEGPHVYLDLYEVDRRYSWPGRYLGYSDWFEGGFGYPERNQGRMLVDVEAGKEYLLYTVASQSMPYIRTVVRIGDYAEEPEWVQPPDISREYLSGLQYPNNRIAMSGSAGFRGGDINIYRSFGMPFTNPGQQDEARDCSWKYSRRTWANTGVTWWSVNGGGVWNGTDPYDANVAGPSTGVCPVYNLPPDQASNGSQRGQVGYEFHMNNSLVGDSMEWYVWASSLIFNPESIIFYEQSVQPWPPEGVEYWPLKQNEWLETEPGGIQLLDVDVRWTTDPSVTQTLDNGVIVKWYKGPVDGYDPVTDSYSAPHPVGKWGPWGEGGNWYGQGPGRDSPENWAASQTHMGDSSGSTGGWQPLLPAWFEKREGVASDGSTFTYYPLTRFTMLPDRMFSDDSPPVGATGEGIETHYTNVKRGQDMEFRVTIRPPRYRIHKDPGIEDLAWAGVAAIAIRPEDAGQVFYDRGVTPVQHGI